jgi:hypothetical protein
MLSLGPDSESTQLAAVGGQVPLALPARSFVLAASHRHERLPFCRARACRVTPRSFRQRVHRSKVSAQVCRLVARRSLSSFRGSLRRPAPARVKHQLALTEICIASNNLWKKAGERLSCASQKTRRSAHAWISISTPEISIMTKHAHHHHPAASVPAAQKHCEELTRLVAQLNSEGKTSANANVALYDAGLALSKLGPQKSRPVLHLKL